MFEMKEGTTLNWLLGTTCWVLTKLSATSLTSTDKSIVRLCIETPEDRHHFHPNSHPGIPSEAFSPCSELPGTPFCHLSPFSKVHLIFTIMVDLISIICTLYWRMIQSWEWCSYGFKSSKVRTFGEKQEVGDFIFYDWGTWHVALSQERLLFSSSAPWHLDFLPWASTQTLEKHKS